MSDFKRQFGAAFGILRLGLFGSVARGENTESSDVDVVVELERPTLSLMHSLRTMLSEKLGCKVDVVRLRPSLRPMLLSNINEEAVYV